MTPIAFDFDVEGRALGLVSDPQPEKGTMVEIHGSTYLVRAHEGCGRCAFRPYDCGDRRVLPYGCNGVIYVDPVEEVTHTLLGDQP